MADMDSDSYLTQPHIPDQVSVDQKFIIVDATPELDAPVINVVTESDPRTFVMQGVTGQSAPENISDSAPLAHIGGDVCQVCHDTGSGYHYSAYSCEGCKGFFKRTVQRNLQYVCKKEEGNCVITKQTRNSCQACRFKACLSIGMKREAVREDRSPGCPGKNRLKQQRIRGISQEKAPFRDDLVETLIAAKPNLIPPSSIPGFSVPVGQNSTGEISLKTVMHFGYNEVRYIIDWAKKIPDFKEFSLEDQMALLKSSFMELNVLRLAFRSMDDDDKVVIADGLAVAIPQFSFYECGFELMMAANKFAKRLKDTKIDQTEFCILNALVLTYPDAIGLFDRDGVLSLQTKIVDALRRYSAYQYPNEPHRYGNLLLRLPFLRILGAKAAEKFLNVRLEGNIPLNALVSEMMT